MSGDGEQDSKIEVEEGARHRRRTCQRFKSPALVQRDPRRKSVMNVDVVAEGPALRREDEKWWAYADCMGSQDI